MTWEPGKKRWAKMYRRERYFVVASKLNPANPTRDATREAANEWWLAKKAQLDGLIKTPDEQLAEEIQADVQAGNLDPAEAHETYIAFSDENTPAVEFFREQIQTGRETLAAR